MNQPEVVNYDAGIYQIEKTDPVLGGLGGITNLPLLQLANRTAWLKTAIDTLESGGGPFAFNASSGNLPTGGTNGAGVAGIKRKDTYYVTVAGTVFGATLQVGDQLTAKVDEADDISEFVIVQANTELATPTVIGMVKLVQSLAAGVDNAATLSVTGLINLFAQLNSPSFTGNPTAPNQPGTENSTKIATTKWVVDRIAEIATSLGTDISSEATARINADNSEATTRANADTTLQNNINSEATARANADNTLNTNKANKLDATAWADLTMPSNATARANKPQWRINQFGEVEFRGELDCTFTVSSGGSSLLLLFLAIPLPTAVVNAINANSYLITKSVTLSSIIGANIGLALLIPCANEITMTTAGGINQIWFSAGGGPGGSFPAGNYNIYVPLNGIRAQIVN